MRRNAEHGVAVPAAAQSVAKRPRSGSITVRIGRPCPKGGIPPMVKPVNACASSAVARRMRGSVSCAARSETSTVVGATDENETRLGSIVAIRDEDEALDDLAHLGADRTRGVLGRMGRFVERDDLESHALARGRIQHALRRGRYLGHGRSLAQATLGRRMRVSSNTGQGSATGR